MLNVGNKKGIRKHCERTTERMQSKKEKMLAVVVNTDDKEGRNVTFSNSPYIVTSGLKSLLILSKIDKHLGKKMM